MSTKENLDRAKIKQDDEFYTSFFDIALELDKWKSKFTGADIICPCDFMPDDKISSITIDFSNKITGPRYFVNSVKKANFITNFNLFDDFLQEEKFKEVSATVIKNLLQSRLTVNFIYYLMSIAESTNINSITASGYNVETGTGVSFTEVDYSKYDICITNPPFSKYSDFMKCLIDAQNTSNLQYILVAPFINRIAPCIGVPLMERKAYLGYGRHLAMEFTNPTTMAKKKVAVDWIVSYPDAQDKLYYTPEIAGETKVIEATSLKEMPGMTLKDGTHPLHIKSIAELPNTDRWLFASAAILDKLRYKKFDGYEWYATGCKKYFNKDYPEKNPFIHKVTNEMIGYGTDESCFHGILFRRVKE